ncbi:MAG: MBL fold metallo-hydrolase [bacterium]|jgi:phosphoribosyl 1,2-cyclic phosphate phosphodiesterase
MPHGLDRLTITVLGSGTSVGVPTIGCDCAVCTSSDPRDNRLRPSVLLSFNGRSVLIDATPDFRTQALRAQMCRLDAILLTHAHADHILGLDDVRPLNYHQQNALPVYGSKQTIAAVRRVFEYAFSDHPHESSVPRLETRVIDGGPFELFGAEFVPVPLKHGSGDVYGFRFGRAAYLTDHSDIPVESMEMLRGLDVLFLDALRRKPHPTHTTLARAIEYTMELRPARAYFTHICHDLAHEATERDLPEGVHLAYDGLQIEVEQ